MVVPSEHASSTQYRYGYQGQEKDDEINGESNSLNFKFRMYDPRIARFFAVDPLFKEYPFYSPYSFSGNRVIDAKEIEGLEPDILFDDIATAAANFGREYNGYSIRNNVEVATQFYTVTGKDDIIRFAYTTPVYGIADKVNVLNANKFPNSDITVVGDAHTHGGDSNTRSSIFYKETNRKATDAQVAKLRQEKMKGIYKFEFFDGDNNPSGNDESFWQTQISRLGEDYKASYTFTPSGLVYGATKNDNGGIKVYINYRLSEINPSDPKSEIRINDVSPDCEPSVAPEADETHAFKK